MIEKQSGALDIKGSYYDDKTPDTLDLAERARIALKGSMNCIDHDMEEQMWFFIDYTLKTPLMRHQMSDIVCNAKFNDALAMLRQMCGDTTYDKELVAYREAMLSYIDNGMYWDRYDKKRPWRGYYNPEIHQMDIREDDIAYPMMAAKTIQTLLTWYQQDPEPRFSKLVDELVEGIDKALIKKDDYAYIPPFGGGGYGFSFFRNTGYSDTSEPEDEVCGTEGSVMDSMGFLLRALVMAYQFYGNLKAKELSDRLAVFLMKPKFWGGSPGPGKHPTHYNVTERLDEPLFIAGEEQGHWYTHFHARCRGLRALLDYGIATSDQRAIEFVRRAYDFSWSMGIPKIGWIPCWPSNGGYNTMEGCALGDIIALAIRLSESGAGDHWDDVDALTRNQLAEAQYLRPDLMHKIVDAAPEKPVFKGFNVLLDESQEYKNIDVVDKTVGVFLSTLSPDGVYHPWVMHCCNINAIQGLYYAWEATVRESSDSAEVNLLLNRASPGLDVYSYLPFEGKVVIKNKSKKQINIRIPGWVDKNSVELAIDDVKSDISYAGRFLLLSGLSGNETIKITFPVIEYSSSYTVCARTPDERKYTISFRGSTVIDISPRDTRALTYPFFLRDDMKKAGETKLIDVTRFIADNPVTVW